MLNPATSESPGTPFSRRLLWSARLFWRTPSISRSSRARTKSCASSAPADRRGRVWTHRRPILERRVGKEDQDRVAHVDVSVIEEGEGDGSRFATAC